VSNMQTVFRSNLFEGKVAIITGGGTGIGLNLAQNLSHLGCKVVICSRKEQVLRKALSTMNGEGHHFVVCNIRNENSVEKSVDEIVQKYGEIDFLVNNAGGQYMSPVESISAKGFRAVLETNLVGHFYMCKAVFNKAFKKQRRGVIVNITANFWEGFPFMAHTGAARAGTDNLTKTLAVEWQRYGIRVNSIAPGMIASGGLGKYDKKYLETIKKMGVNNLAGRLGTNAEVTNPVIFLLSPGASYITGSSLRVDAGESITLKRNPWMKPLKRTWLDVEGELRKISNL